MPAISIRQASLIGVLCLAALAHGIFSWDNRTRRPELSVIDPPPAQTAVKALAFGDEEFLYRYWALDLQNDGDTGGRATPMRNYNYDYVLGWLKTLRSLDPRAHDHTYLAVRYFSQTPRKADIRRIVDFVVEDAEAVPEQKWYWLTQAEEMAEKKLDDLDYALTIARQTAGYNFKDVPSWVWLFPAVLLEKQQRYAEAREVIEAVRQGKADRLEPEALHWMDDFESHLP